MNFANEWGLSCLLLSFLKEEFKSLYAFFDSSRLRYFVKWLVFFIDVVLIFIIYVHIGSLNVGKA